MKKRYLLIVLIFFIITGTACSGRASEQELADEWQTAAPESVGLHRGRLAQLTQKFEDGTFSMVRSLLIVKNKKLVYEKYFHGFHADRTHPVFSITKSISSALTGIAIDEKFIKDEHVKIKTFFSGIEDIDWDEKKSKITIQDVLTMTAGLEWNESLPYSDWGNTHRRMVRSSDWIKFVLNLPMEYEPGEVFDYNTGTSNLLAVILEKATGMKFDKFAKTYLLEPLGIKKHRWYRDPSNNPCTGGSHGGIFLRPRDMAKIGLLFLEKGNWKGKSVISPAWVDASTGEQGVYKNYGYLWWRSAAYANDKTYRFYSARGFGGQRITVIPGLDMVVVATSGYYGPKRRTGNMHLYTILYQYIIKAATMQAQAAN
jgi:CubicO group peptidase (beta-lactamase class C family)